MQRKLRALLLQYDLQAIQKNPLELFVFPCREKEIILAMAGATAFASGVSDDSMVENAIESYEKKEKLPQHDEYDGHSFHKNMKRGPFLSTTIPEPFYHSPPIFLPLRKSPVSFTYRPTGIKLCIEIKNQSVFFHVPSLYGFYSLQLQR